MSGSLQGKLAVGREGVDAHRVAVRVVGGVVVDLLTHPAVEEVLAAPGLGDVREQLAALGRRVDIRVDASDGYALGSGNPLLRMGQRHLDLLGLPCYFYCAPTPAGMSMPYSSAALRQHSFLALFGRQRAGQLLDITALPVRIAGAEHHHVVLAGEAEPFAGELGVAGTVEAALDEIHVTGQVVARDPRCPRRLLEVRPAERVHPPDERRHEVRGTVGPDELQAVEALEHALGDHVHQVIDVVQRHEADVLLVGAGVPGRRRRKHDPEPTSMCAATGRPASTAASHSGQNCGLP